MKFFSVATFATVALAGMAAATDSSKCGSGHKAPSHVSHPHSGSYHKHHDQSHKSHHESHDEPHHTSTHHEPHHTSTHHEPQHTSTHHEPHHTSTHHEPHHTSTHHEPHHTSSSHPSKSTGHPSKGGDKPSKGDDNHCCIKKGSSKKDICSEFQKGGLINIGILGCSKTDISLLSNLLNRDEEASVGRQRFERRNASTKSNDCVESQEDKCKIYQSAALINLDILGCSANSIDILSDIL